MFEDGLLRFKNRVYVPPSDGLRSEILEEVHKSGYTIHLRAIKMYQDLKKSFWWSSMKSDITEFVSKCLTCQKVKIEHERPGGLLHPLNIPKWK